MAPILAPGRVERVRTAAVRMLTEQLGCREWYEREVLQERPDHGGSRAEDLPHWMLWALGCRDSKILNRDVPDCRIRWSRGDSVDRLMKGAQRMAAWRPFQLERSPAPGDILVMEQSHVMSRTAVVVSVSEGNWEAVGGWGSCTRRLQLTVKGFHAHFSGSKVAVLGWIDLEHVTLED